MTDEVIAHDVDVVVVGTGAGGLLTALRCHDLGLKVLVIEKSHYVGGTSALSGGGFWAPGNHLMGENAGKDREEASKYLRHIMNVDELDDRLESFLDAAPQMVRYLTDIGMEPAVFPSLPDYRPNVPGSVMSGRGLYMAEMDAAELGDDLRHLREPAATWKIFNRYVITMEDGFLLATQTRGWKRRILSLFARYWLDVPWRLRTRRDRRLTLGNALVGRLLVGIRKRGIRIERNLGLVRLINDRDHITGVVAVRDGVEHEIHARRGVVLATGGFEHNQVMRDAHLPVPTSAAWSLTPGSNTGDGIRAAQAVGAQTELLDLAWWIPVVSLPLVEAPDKVAAHIIFRQPHMVIVNRKGDRFTNEATPYDCFSIDQINDHLATGGTVPAWGIFDANFRKKYTCGNILPSFVTPDSALPKAWWDSYIYRADTIEALAEKIGLDPSKLQGVITRTNGFAAAGVDPEFGRGSSAFDRLVCGDPRLKPNAALGPINKGPYYAIRIDLGDMGTKGGLRIDKHARVVRKDSTPIDGLYATGNTTGTIFNRAYPGSGSTLGPAMTFAFIAANHMANHATN
jgi:3-oxosteroid 1-dehydrogenase